MTKPNPGQKPKPIKPGAKKPGAKKPRPKKLGVPLDVARKQLMDDPDTQELADIFGVPLEEYVELVLDYAQNPDKEAQVTVLDEGELDEEDVDYPTVGDVLRWFQQVESGEVDVTPEHEKITDEVSSNFEVERSKKIAGLQANLQAPRQGSTKRKVMVNQDDPMGSVLKNQLQAQRTSAQIPGKKKKKAKRRSTGAR